MSTSPTTATAAETSQRDLGALLFPYDRPTRNARIMRLVIRIAGVLWLLLIGWGIRQTTKPREWENQQQGWEVAIAVAVAIVPLIAWTVFECLCAHAVYLHERGLVHRRWPFPRRTVLFADIVDVDLETRAYHSGFASYTCRMRLASARTIKFNCFIADLDHLASETNKRVLAAANPAIGDAAAIAAGG